MIAAAWLGVIGAQIIGAAKITAATCGIPYGWAAAAVDRQVAGRLEIFLNRGYISA